MKVYLVQHGESLSKEKDPLQSLSQKGITDIEHLADFLVQKNLDIAHIFHSSKRRSEQSAKLLAKSLVYPREIEFHREIEPLDDVNPFIEEIIQQKHDILIVSHMPFLSKLIGKLIVQDENKSIVNFIPGTIVCIEKNFEGKWGIHFVWRPG